MQPTGKATGAQPAGSGLGWRAIVLAIVLFWLAPLAAVLLAVSEAPVWRWLSVRTLAVLAVGILLLAAWCAARPTATTPWSTCG